MLEAVAIERVEGSCPVGDDLLITAHGAISEFAAPVDLIVIVAQVHVARVEGDREKPVQQADGLAGDELVGRDQANGHGRISLRAGRAPAELGIDGLVAEPVRQPARRLQRHRCPRRDGELLVGRVPHRDDRGEG